MADEKPNYLSLLKDIYTDPSYVIPAGTAGLTAGGSALVKNRKRIVNAITSADPVKKAAVAAKVEYGLIKPVIQNKVITPALNAAQKAAPTLFDPIQDVVGRAAKPLVTAMRPMTDPIANTVSAVAKTPFGQAVGAGAKTVGKGLSFLNNGLIKPVHKALYTGAGGRAHMVMDTMLGSSSAGEPPNLYRAQNAQNNQFNNLYGMINRGLKPGYLSGLSENAEKLHLSRIRDMMVDIGYDPRVIEFALTAMANPQAEQHQPESVRQMLLKHLPPVNVNVDPRFSRTNDLGNLLNGLSFGATDYGANVLDAATGGAFPALNLLKTSTSQIQDAMVDDYHNNLREYLTRNQRRR